MSVLAQIAAFLLAHSELIELVKKAIDGGSTDEEIMQTIKAAMVAASDAEMIREGVT